MSLIVSGDPNKKKAEALSHLTRIQYFLGFTEEGLNRN